MAEAITMVQAINLAMGRALQEDDRVILLGEDIGIDGGVFRATAGLLDRFGKERVRDTPLAEAAIAGISVGIAAQGFRPVAEIQFDAFALPCLDQIANHASRLRTRTRGRLTCPMVLRVPYGGGIKAPEHHSDSIEGYFAHVPGLRVVVPSSPRMAYGLLLSAIRDPDPVLFLEPKRLYRFTKEPVSDVGAALPLDTCFTLREGHDITLVAWGAMTVETSAAAELLGKSGISAEVIDVATLRPLDTATILASVSKTGRIVVAHEAVRTGGFGAEIAASIAEGGLMSLLAPIRRVTAPDCVVPLSRLEGRYFPRASDIAAAARELMEFR